MCLPVRKIQLSYTWIANCIELIRYVVSMKYRFAEIREGIEKTVIVNSKKNLFPMGLFFERLTCTILRDPKDILQKKYDKKKLTLQKPKLQIFANQDFAICALSFSKSSLPYLSIRFQFHNGFGFTTDSSRDSFSSIFRRRICKMEILRNKSRYPFRALSPRNAPQLR